MADVLYQKTGLFGAKTELHIAPEGLTLAGRGGPDAVEFVPIADVAEAGAALRWRKGTLTVSFKTGSPSWVFSGLPRASAEWAAALISEEVSAVEKRGRTEYNEPASLDGLQGRCDAITAAGDGHAAVDLVDFVLVQGVLHGASDVHFDPFADSVAVRFRMDGVLRDMAQLDSGIKRRLTSRLKVVSRLATYKRAIAQEGRAAVKVGGRTVDFRFSSIPTIHGEKVAVRIFDPANSIMAVGDLGMTPDMLAAFESALMQPQGTILLTGPAGSGKTTTMYAALKHLRENKKNLSSIATVEDPVEYDLHVVNQTQVNTSQGLTFANALRTVLRQDPEVIMIGEIRDQETADIAVQAGLTGHMILSTVHARSAAGVMLRLVDLGVEPYLLASSVGMIVSQRLVRTVCKACARDYVPTPEETEKLGLRGSDRFVAGSGCAECGGTGYRGRTGIFQILPVTDQIRELVLKRSSLGELEEQVAREQVKTLVDDGLEKARLGITSLEELARVLGEGTPMRVLE